jgi:hypothetical protein
VRNRGVELRLGGYNLRRAGRALKVSHQSVLNWVKIAYPEPAVRGIAALFQGPIKYDFEELTALCELTMAGGSVRRENVGMERLPDGFAKRLRHSSR